MPFQFNPITSQLDLVSTGGGGGGVTSVSGTANRITSTGGATPVIDISAAYVGQSSITTLGTITTGTWNGTAVGPTFGGTGLTSYTTGDLIYSSSGNTLSNLSLGTIPGQGPVFNGSTLAYNNPLQSMSHLEDFLVIGGLVTWANFATNGGSVNWPATPDAGHPGVVSLSTGTSTNGYAIIALGQASTTVDNLILGGGTIDLYMVFKLTALSNGTDTYEISVGYGNSTNFPNTSYDDGVFFNYSSTINSGNWQLSTSSSSTKTTSNTSTAVTTNWNTLRINVNANATLATFYVNGASVGTISTNIPTTNTVSPIFSIAKSAGTTDVDMKIDLIYMYQTLTNPR